MSIVIHFLWLKSLTAVEISRELDEVYGKAVLSLRTVERWLARFAAVRRVSKNFPGAVGPVQTRILLLLPNYSPMIPTFHRKRLL
jgi:hypothetical protein